MSDAGAPDGLLIELRQKTVQLLEAIDSGADAGAPAGDTAREIEVVARFIAEAWHHREATVDDWDREQAQKTIAALDRVRAGSARCPDGRHVWETSGDPRTTCVRCGVAWADSARDEDHEAICPECHGNGFPEDYPNRTCKMCFGTGKVTSVRPSPVDDMARGEDYEAVWVIFTEGSRVPTDVVAEREEHDTLANETAVEYVPASRPSPVDDTERLREALADAEQVVMDALAALNPAAASRLMDTSTYRRFAAALSVDAGKPEANDERDDFDVADPERPYDPAVDRSTDLPVYDAAIKEQVSARNRERAARAELAEARASLERMSAARLQQWHEAQGWKARAEKAERLAAQVQSTVADLAERNRALERERDAAERERDEAVAKLERIRG